MKTFILGLLIIISSTAYSQKKDLQVINNEKVFGKHLLNNSEIKGNEYIFPERIENTYLDTLSGFATIQLRGLTKNGKWLDNFGNFLVYDLNDKQLKWSKKIAYQTSSLSQMSNVLIFTELNKSYCLDMETGNELWKAKNDIYFVDRMYNIGVGYNFKKQHELEGVNLKDGEIIWNKELKRDFGWNKVFYANDSTLIIVSAGLHAVNLKNGSGWDYNTVTGKKDYKETILKNVAGAALGALTGVGVISTGHNLVSDLVSNVLQDSLSYYLASKEQIAKIDKYNGNVLWSIPFSKDLPSKSSIFMNDSLVFMVNKGYAFLGRKQINFGTPFIAAFNKETGEQKYMSELAEGEQILAYHVLNKEIYLVYKNKIAKYSQENGSLINSIDFPHEELGELKYLVGRQVFKIDENNLFSSLIESDRTKVFVFTNKDKVVSIDSDLKIDKALDFKDLNIYYLRTKDYRFLAKENVTWIIDNEGKKIAEFEATSKSFLIGKTLYNQKDDRFSAIDLSGIISTD